MEFGEVPITVASGAILAHSLRTSGGKLKKGRVLTQADIAELRSSGYQSVTVARLGSADVSENKAAAVVAAMVRGPGLDASKAFTGRVNLHATVHGLMVIDPLSVETINSVDESVTLCTLAPWSPVVPHQQVATVKIIPFAVSERLLDTLGERLGDKSQLRVSAFRPRRVGLVQTTLPGTPNNLLEKMVAVTEERLAALTCHLDYEVRCEHGTSAVARSLNELLEHDCELICILGASAVVDRRDVVPAGIEAAGGELQHFGFPIDPGNLILTARLGPVPVLALPGSVRSPRPSGFDEVLHRIIADVPPSMADIARMGVGGLLK